MCAIGSDEIEDFIDLCDGAYLRAVFSFFTFAWVNTVNLILFATTLFGDLQESNWVVTTYFRELALSSHVLVLQPYNKDWYEARNVLDDGTLAKNVISCLRKNG